MSLHKSNKVTAIDPATGEEAPLFHPLQQDWSDHFELQAGAVLAGRTPAGRASVAAMRMNEPLPRAARAFQAVLGLR